LDQVLELQLGCLSLDALVEVEGGTPNKALEMLRGLALAARIIIKG